MSVTMIDRAHRLHRRRPGRAWQFAAAYRALTFLRCTTCEAPIAPGELCARTGNVAGYQCLKCDHVHDGPLNPQDDMFDEKKMEEGCQYCLQDQRNWQRRRTNTAPCPTCKGTGRVRVELFA